METKERSVGKQAARKKTRLGKRVLDFLLGVSIMLTAGTLIGGTVAWLVARTASVENAFIPSKVTTAVAEETFDGNTKRNVCLENTGDTEAYIRTAVVVTWQNGGGDILADKPAAADYTIVFASNTGWDLDGSDGYYYFKSPVEGGGKTGVLIASCKPKAAAPMAGYTLHVEIIGSGIQSTPASAVSGAWGVTVATDGTIGK